MLFDSLYSLLNSFIVFPVFLRIKLFFKGYVPSFGSKHLANNQQSKASTGRIDWTAKWFIYIWPYIIFSYFHCSIVQLLHSLWAISQPFYRFFFFYRKDHKEVNQCLNKMSIMSNVKSLNIISNSERDPLPSSPYANIFTHTLNYSLYTHIVEISDTLDSDKCAIKWNRQMPYSSTFIFSWL